MNQQKSFKSKKKLNFPISNGLQLTSVKDFKKSVLVK